MSTNYPTFARRTETGVVLSFLDASGEAKELEVPFTMLKGQAQWAAKRLGALGATVPPYKTEDRETWATSLRQAAV